MQENCRVSGMDGTMAGQPCLRGGLVRRGITFALEFLGWAFFWVFAVNCYTFCKVWWIWMHDSDFPRTLTHVGHMMVTSGLLERLIFLPLGCCAVFLFEARRCRLGRDMWWVLRHVPVRWHTLVWLVLWIILFLLLVTGAVMAVVLHWRGLSLEDINLSRWIAMNKDMFESLWALWFVGVILRFYVYERFDEERQ